MNLSKFCCNIIDDFFTEAEESEKRIMTFGLEVILSTVISAVLLLLVASLLGVLSTSLIVLFSAGSIKLFSGGVHAKTLLTCSLTGAIIFSLAGVTVEYLVEIIRYNSLILIIWLVFFSASLCIYMYAPADISGNIINNRYRILKLKKFSFLVLTILILATFIMLIMGNYKRIIIAILVGILIQMFMLSPVAYFLYNRGYR